MTDATLPLMVPRGGSVSPYGEILDAAGRPILAANGQVMRVELPDAPGAASASKPSVTAFTGPKPIYMQLSEDGGSNTRSRRTPRAPAASPRYMDWHESPRYLDKPVVSTSMPQRAPRPSTSTARRDPVPVYARIVEPSTPGAHPFGSAPPVGTLEHSLWVSGLAATLRPPTARDPSRPPTARGRLESLDAPRLAPQKKRAQSPRVLTSHTQLTEATEWFGTLAPISGRRRAGAWVGTRGSTPMGFGGANRRLSRE